MDFNNKNQYRRWKTKLNKNIDDHLNNNQLNLDNVFQLNELNQNCFDQDNMINQDNDIIIENNFDDIQDEYDADMNSIQDNDLDDNIIKQILSIYVKSNISNDQMDEILNLLNLINDYYTSDKNILSKKKLKIPKNLYHLKKENKFNVSKLIGFITSCCNHQQVSLDNSQPIHCEKCNQKIKKSNIVKSKNCFLFYDIKEFISFILNNYDLKDVELSNDGIIRSFYDGDIYRKFISLSDHSSQILPLIFNSDGVPIFNSNSNQLWPLFIKIPDIDGKKTENKFLIGCYLTTTNKPDSNFFLEYIVKQLNSIYLEGVYSLKLDKEVKPILFNFILDLPARALFLQHHYYNGERGCTDCYDTGERIKAKGKDKVGTVRVYKPNDNMRLRTLDEHKKIVEILIKDNFVDFLGVVGKTELINLVYFDYIIGVHPDLMHMVFSGISPRLLNYQLSYENKARPSYIDKKYQEILNERILKSNFNSNFKRLPKSIFDLNNWKSTQNFDYFFYIGPLFLKSILKEEVYNHYLLLVYIISKLYNGGLNDQQLIEIDVLIKMYLNKLNQYYDDYEFTMNIHQLNHLVTAYKNYGPLKNLTAFSFESFNGEIKRSVNAGYGVLEQIFNRNDLKITYNLKTIKDNDEKFKTTTNGYKKDNLTCYTKIVKDNLIIKSSDHSKSLFKDYYVKINNRYYKVNYFYKDYLNKLFFCGEIINILDNFNFKIDDKNLVLDYILKAKQSTIKDFIEVNDKIERVLFNPIFKEKSSDIDDPDLGYIIEFKFLVHN